MIFLTICSSDIFVFLYSGDIIHINSLIFVGVEPTNATCPPSTATSDVLNHYITEVSQKKGFSNIVYNAARRCSTFCIGVLYFIILVL